MKPEVICVGDLLVEIMREKIDEPLNVPGTFVGPFPSGASGIFIDAVAKLGEKAGFIGAVGDDDFGTLILQRLQEDGVDTSQIRVLKDYTTGTAFVTYFSDGSRKFIYHLDRAATGQIYPEWIEETYFSNIKYLHIVGSTISINEHCREACYRAVHYTKKRGGKISFDPNLRPELSDVQQIKEFLKPILSKSDIIFPSGREAELLTEKIDSEEACREFLRHGCEIVALKRGQKGSTVFSSTEKFEIPAFQVEEVDPTGAGDCYCAGFIMGLLKGLELNQVAKIANAVGALAVAKKGPMEGAPTLEETCRVAGINFFDITT